MGFRSFTCSSRNTGKPLMTYSTVLEATSQAEYSARAHQNPLSPYPCHRCQAWHLAPFRETLEYCIQCVGRDRQPKRSYASKVAAEDQAGRLFTQRRLRAYQCPRGHGWHLTSK